MSLSKGIAALQAGRIPEACAFFARARQADPRSPEAAFCHATALIAAGELQAAETGLREALRLRPSYVDAFERLALLLQKQGRFQEALPLHDARIRLQPKSPQAWTGYGACLFELERLDASLRCYERALSFDGAAIEALFGRASALHKLQRYEEAVKAYDVHLARNPANRMAWSQRLMAANHLSTLSRSELWEAHRKFGASFKQPPPRSFTGSRDPERRLRVGVVSPDLRTHSVSFFFEPLLRHLDKDAFEVILYHDNKVSDAISERLKSQAALWRTLWGLDDARAEEIILADAPDILVDLAGHAGLNRLALFARRLAPVQISYLGYPNTTGLETMDFRFVDPITDPGEEDQAFHSETLIRFSDCAWSYDPLLATPDPVPEPREPGRGPTFGSFNYLGKVTDEVMCAWRAILEAVPGSRLLLKSPDLSCPDIHASALRRLGASGLGEGRVELLPRAATHQEHMATYDRVDLALDPFPYNGTTTTCEALWMGVPVLTLKGDRHAARVGASMMTAIGHPEWIAADREDYVRRAVALARQELVSGRSRLALRETLRTSLLMNHSLQSQRFGAALRSCWIARCR